MSPWRFEKHKAAIIAHAEEAFPEEACGVIHDGKYVRVANIYVPGTGDDEFGFEFSDADSLRYLDDPKTEAVVHSHPEGPEHPTPSDQAGQIASGLPWVCIAHTMDRGWVYFEYGDHLLDVPLEDREFSHAIFDCYENIRSWWWQVRRIKLPPFVRQDMWWEHGDNLYLDHFAEAGFRRMTDEERKDLQPGDVFLYKGKARTPYHGGVFVGDGMIQHHLPGKGRLSRREPLQGWFTRVECWLRRDE
jgi:cell wall-associated NlpC family hydrolase